MRSGAATAQLTLFRSPQPAAPRPVAGARAVPLTAGSDVRASADVRRDAWDLAERFPSLEPIEALCRLEGASAADLRPGVVLLDRHFPIWLAVLDDRVFVAVNCELLEGAARERFAAAGSYVAFLAERGFRWLVDHRSKTSREVDTSGSGLVPLLAAAGSSRRFDQLRTDRRLGFLSGFLGFAVGDLLITGTRPTVAALALSLVKGAALGLVITAVQYYQARSALDARLRQIRDEIISDAAPAERLHFGKPRVRLWSDLFAVVLFGALTAFVYPVNNWRFFVFLAAFLIACCGALRHRRGEVALDGQGIEGGGRAVRARENSVWRRRS